MTVAELLRSAGSDPLIGPVGGEDPAPRCETAGHTPGSVSCSFFASLPHQNIAVEQRSLENCTTEYKQSGKFENVTKLVYGILGGFGTRRQRIPVNANICHIRRSRLVRIHHNKVAATHARNCGLEIMGVIDLNKIIDMKNTCTCVSNSDGWFAEQWVGQVTPGHG